MNPAVTHAAAAEGILGAVGHTPLVRLTGLFPNAGFAVFAKLEFLNPAGSMKDRSAQRMVEQALASGRVRPGGLIIESSSGNMAMGLAQACRAHGLRLCCVLDPRTTAVNQRLLRCLGAIVEMVSEPDPATGEFLPARLARVRELLARNPGAYWTNQYANPDNALAHTATISEICDQLGGQPDWLFCAMSTCGTLRGCSDWLRARGSPCHIVGVDAEGSAISGGPGKPRLLAGAGSAIRPDLFHRDLANLLVAISDFDSIRGCRLLLERESILAGGSSGSLVAALQRCAGQIPEGALCVLILADRGERYVETIYCDDWVRNHFGQLP